MRHALLLCCLLLGCHLPDPRVKGVQHDPRPRIAARDLAWANDTIPVLRFNPPFIYGSWKLQVESCSGLSKAGWPRFYVAPVNPIGPGWGGYYASQSQSIVLALGNEVNPDIVKHELLHWLLDPINGHPEDFYDTRCGDVLGTARR